MNAIVSMNKGNGRIHLLDALFWCGRIDLEQVCHQLSTSTIYMTSREYSTHPSTYPPILPSLLPFIHPSIHLSFHPFDRTFQSFYPSIHASIHPPVHPSTHSCSQPLTNHPSTHNYSHRLLGMCLAKPHIRQWAYRGDEQLTPPLKYSQSGMEINN